METKTHYISAGFFVLATFVGISLFLLWMGQFKWKLGEIYNIHFNESITGLRKNEIVSYDGVPIGKVIEIDVNLELANTVQVLVEIYRPELIRESSFAVLESKGITGMLQIRILGSLKKSPILQSRDIPSRASSLQSFIDQTPKILTQISDLLNEKNVDSIHKTLEHLETFTSKLNIHNDEITKTLKKIQHSFELIDQTILENRSHLKKFTSTGLGNFESLVKTLDQMAQKLNTNPSEYIFRPENKGEIIPE